jgi:hypothetical protein
MPNGLVDLQYKVPLMVKGWLKRKPETAASKGEG